MAPDCCHKIDWKLLSDRWHAFDGRDVLREHWFLLKVTLGRLLRLIIVSPDTGKCFNSYRCHVDTIIPAKTLSLAEHVNLLAKHAK